MKLNTIMPKGLKHYYKGELNYFKDSLLEKDWQKSWQHLERAHILGQAYPYEHSQVHWLMLKFGFKIKDIKEIMGQIPRLLVGGIKSFVGEIPVGNTGGAYVPPLRPMPIPEDLQLMLSEAIKK